MSSARASATKTRTGCQNCRLRHLKCDDHKPACSKCQRSGLECLRGYNIRFKHGANPSVANLKDSGLPKTEYDFSEDQPWVKTTRGLTFLDETPELLGFYEHGQDDDEDSHPAPLTTSVRKEEHAPAQRETRSNTIISTTTSNDTFSPNDWQSSLQGGVSPSSSTYRASMPTSSSAPLFSNTGEPPSPGAPWHTQPTGYTPVALPHESQYTGMEYDQATQGSILSLHNLIPYTPASEPSLSRLYLDSPAWPLSDPEEARLLRHFVEKLAPNFDLTDPLQHFRKVVPQRAGICPPLLNAIFALSARHLSRISRYDELIANKYIQECLKYLIPGLDDSSAILDENLLASIIILRHLEEFEVPLSGQQPAEQQRHLFGAHAFITAQERSAISGGLRQAAFWVGLRQEIYVAFVNQRSIIPALEHCNVDRSFDPAPDHVWACRMVANCADVLRYCFGESDSSNGMYSYLSSNVDEWDRRKPSSFTPIYRLEPDDTRPFPELWYVADEVSTGIQHWRLAKILLVAHNPRIPRLGMSRTAALKSADDEIKEHVKHLCGICLSNPNCPPNFIVAAMAITMAGDKFTNRREQEGFLHILDLTERQNAWLTGAARANLKLAWGWTDD